MLCNVYWLSIKIDLGNKIYSGSSIKLSFILLSLRKTLAKHGGLISSDSCLTETGICLDRTRFFCCWCLNLKILIIPSERSGVRAIGHLYMDVASM
jgi:hypothetical protein